MAKTLQLVFQNQAGKNVTINIPEVRDGLTSEEIKNLMQLIITKNIFESTGGDLVALMEANIISRDVQEVAVR
ncbi:DUF2922 domain-containing protein [Fonticella tunisiensis]|uniref:DUF2922 family protein n=1 Tax=Fonticella tunisiensis TaxID=1096341 RepID=A0A4R7KTD7_9CLOT|nr:DUF2922 domain-containing protein [Fonticella tunisiensis]TDT62409.1 DUF2922 family protein [Fonticella tunisiensis]